MAHEQSDTEILLELADLHTERCLRDVQLVGGARHITGLDDADEVFELTEIHAFAREQKLHTRFTTADEETRQRKMFGATGARRTFVA
jgi:hypothetical protein